MDLFDFKDEGDKSYWVNANNKEEYVRLEAQFIGGKWVPFKVDKDNRVEAQ
jgi:hypothetical protein